MIFTVFLLLLSPLLVSCRQRPARAKNVCDDDNSYDFKHNYQTFDNKDCKPKTQLTKDGHCQHWYLGKNNCTTFCQTDTSFYFGNEIPVPNSYCKGPRDCWIRGNVAQQVKFDLGFDSKLLNTWRSGASGSYEESAVATGHARMTTLQAGECGYYAFIPVRKQSCGILTTASKITTGMFGFSVCGGKPVGKRICGNQPQRLSGVRNMYNGQSKANGAMVFVRIDCGTKRPLPMNMQEEAYTKPSVALPWPRLVAYFRSWEGGILQRNSCFYKGHDSHTHFEVRGIMWTPEQLGPNAQNLYYQIQGCNAGGSRATKHKIADWHFEWTPNDKVGWEWHANGTLHGHPDDCVGHAIKTAGGPRANVDQCHEGGLHLSSDDTSEYKLEPTSYYTPEVYFHY